MNLSPEYTASLIDHALLKPDMSRKEVREGCELAKHYGVASVCVRGYDVSYAAGLLSGSSVAVGTVIGFPHGNAPSEAKLAELLLAVKNGASEVDCVLPIGLIKSMEWDYVESEMALLAQGAHECDAIIKFIFETCYLSNDMIIACCELAEKAGADFVKTSTGFGSAGASVEAVALMRAHVGADVSVKASGGIHSYAEVLALYEAGARRIGASATAKIIEEARRAQQGRANV